MIVYRSQAAAVRTQMERSTAGSDRQRNKLASLEAKLLLDSANLPFRFVYKPRGTGSKASQSFTFLLSSEFERTLWVEATETLRRNLEGSPVIHLQPEEVESHIRACRTAVEPIGGAMKSPSVQAIGGELQVIVHSLRGLPKACGTFIIIPIHRNSQPEAIVSLMCFLFRCLRCYWIGLVWPLLS